MWAFSAALREAIEIDPRYGGYLSCDLTAYVVAVNADIGKIEVGFIDRSDPANSTGRKGLGEVVMAGAAAAIANAIFHATGKAPALDAVSDRGPALAMMIEGD